MILASFLFLFFSFFRNELDYYDCRLKARNYLMLCTLSTSGRNKRSSIPVVLRFDIKKEKKKKNERRGINYRHGNFLPISAKHRVIHRATKCHDRTLFLRNGGEKKEEKKKMPADCNDIRGAYRLFREIEWILNYPLVETISTIYLLNNPCQKWRKCIKFQKIFENF